MMGASVKTVSIKSLSFRGFSKSCPQEPRCTPVSTTSCAPPARAARISAKIASTGNRNILLTERGSSFGYNNLVVDMRSLAIMRRTGYPVVFDATHSVQLPGGAGDSSGGQREFVGDLSRAAVAVGIDALFWEVHENPDQARCDGPNSLALDSLKEMLQEVLAIDAIVKKAR